MLSSSLANSKSCFITLLAPSVRKRLDEKFSAEREETPPPKRHCIKIDDLLLPDMLSKPYRKISQAKIKELGASQPTLTIQWLPSATTPLAHARTLIDKIPLRLIRAFSKYCIDNTEHYNLDEAAASTPKHLSKSLLLWEGNGQAYKTVFEWMNAQAAGIDSMESLEFDISPLHQCNKLLEAADFLGVRLIKPSIGKKIEQVKKETYMYSDTIPLLLTSAPNSSDWNYVVTGLHELIYNKWLAEDERNLMVIKNHYPQLVVDLDETLATRRAADALEDLGNGPAVSGNKDRQLVKKDDTSMDMVDIERWKAGVGGWF